jgi:hypothetical protein
MQAIEVKRKILEEAMNEILKCHQTWQVYTN